MAMLEIDLSKEGFAVAPAGVYRARVEHSEISLVKDPESKNQGKPQVRWTFCLLEPATVVDPLTSAEIITEGIKIPRNTPAWPGGSQMLKQLYESCGVQYSTTHIETMDLHGSELLVEVVVGEWKGEPRNEITRFAALPGQ